MVKAGDLTDRVVFERKTTSPGGSTSVSTQTTWASLLTTWAKVITLSGSDQTREGKTTGENRIRLWIRYRTDVSIRIGDRVTWRGNVWLVETPPVPDERRFSFTFDAIIDFTQT